MHLITKLKNTLYSQLAGLLATYKLLVSHTDQASWKIRFKNTYLGFQYTSYSFQIHYWKEPKADSGTVATEIKVYLHPWTMSRN